MNRPLPRLSGVALVLSADGYALLGSALNWAGRPAEAIRWVEKAMRLNPDIRSYAFQLGKAIPNRAV